MNLHEQDGKFLFTLSSRHKCRFPELVDDSPGTATVSCQSEGLEIHPSGISAEHRETIEIFVRQNDCLKSEVD
jgi:hypothetical protein